MQASNMRSNLAATWLAAVVLAGLATPAVAGSTRPLYVFAPSAGDGRLAEQRSINAASSGGYRERDMTVTVVAGDSVSGSSRSAAALRSRFGVGPGQFRVILVGKDGGVKLSSGSPVAAGTLLRLIDSMPMRAQEMRERGR